MKCNADLKSITGDIFTKQDIQELKQNLKSKDDQFFFAGNIATLDTEVYCSSLKSLDYEARNIFVDGKWIDGSTYRHTQKRKRERLSVDNTEHKEIIDFAQECINIYNPFPVTVIDVGMSWEGLKCIEYNTFNGSGWYDCDYENIVQSVSNWVIENA